jgi:hypothetical protein
LEHISDLDHLIFPTYHLYKNVGRNSKQFYVQKAAHIRDLFDQAIIEALDMITPQDVRG